MIYFIYGNQSATIKSQVNKIVSSFFDKEAIDDLNMVKIDGHNITVQEAIDECRYVALGYDKKAVILENCYFLTKPKPRNKIESDQEYDVLKKYISSGENDDNVLFILSVTSSSIDEKNEIVSLLRKNSKVIETKDPDEKDFNDYIIIYCKKHNIVIDKDAISELANRCDNDVALFKNSIEKLALYTDHIRFEDVTKLVSRKLEDQAFLLSNYLLDNNNGEALNLYRDLRVNNVEPVTLINQLANQFRLINEIRFLLREKRLTAEEAANELIIKPGRVRALARYLSLLSEKKTLDTLEELYKLDYDIKSGQVDRLYAFELFLINFQRN